MTPDEAATMTVAPLSAMRTMQAESGDGPCEVAAPLGALALAYSSAGLVLRLRSVAEDECKEDEWLANLCRQSADEIEKLREGLAALESMQTDPTASKIARHYLGISSPNKADMPTCKP